MEMGVRLGQGSEFALLIAVLAQQTGAIREPAAYLVQIAVILTMMVSTYVIVLRYPSPIAIREELRRN
jgi:Kef-type K+ transport system membrane component KefB